MLKRSQEQAREVRRNMRGGAGEVRIRHYVNKEEMGGGMCRLCARLELPPGSGIGLHEHSQEDEIFIIEQGQGEVDDNGSRYTVQAGDAIITGNGGRHALTNSGAEPLVIIAVIIQYPPQ